MYKGLTEGYTRYSKKPSGFSGRNQKCIALWSCFLFELNHMVSLQVFWYQQLGVSHCGLKRVEHLIHYTMTKRRRPFNSICFEPYVATTCFRSGR